MTTPPRSGAARTFVRGVFDWSGWRARLSRFESSRTRWQRRWLDANYVPPWCTGDVPSDLEVALERGWLGDKGTLLDVGCGDGMTSVHLASLGFDVTGIDFSEAAVERARSRARRVGSRARFDVCDITRAVPLGRFDVILDRGCFHAMTSAQAHGYASHLARACVTGARVVLVAPVSVPGLAGGPRWSAADIRSKVERVMWADFATIDEWEGHGNRVERRLMSFYLERR